jgi:hypothetical protein
MVLSRSEISERDTLVFNYIKNVLVVVEKAAASTRAAHLCDLISNPINFPVRERKRFILFLNLESVSIRLMLTSDCVFLRFVTLRCVS